MIVLIKKMRMVIVPSHNRKLFVVETVLVRMAYGMTCLGTPDPGLLANTKSSPNSFIVLNRFSKTVFQVLIFPCNVHYSVSAIRAVMIITLSEVPSIKRTRPQLYTGLRALTPSDAI